MNRREGRGRGGSVVFNLGGSKKRREVCVFVADFLVRRKRKGILLFRVKRRMPLVLKRIARFSKRKGEGGEG